jgi:hypothetical protein
VGCQGWRRLPRPGVVRLPSSGWELLGIKIEKNDKKKKLFKTEKNVSIFSVKILFVYFYLWNKCAYILNT